MLRILLEGGKPLASDAPVTQTPPTTSTSGITVPVGSPQSYTSSVLTRAAEDNRNSTWVEEEFARIVAARNKAPSNSR